MKRPCLLRKERKSFRLLLLLLVVFTVFGAFSWTPFFEGDRLSTGLQAAEDPLVIQGRRLYTQVRCQYCHRIKGRGGTVGPALDNVGFTRTREWLADHFRDPQNLSKGSKMPLVPLTDDQVKALTAFMNSLGGRTFTKEASVLYLAYCSSCHRMNNIGGLKGPDLSYEGQFRDIDFIQSWVKNPISLKPTTTMPSFGRMLTDAQIKDLAIYVFRGGH